MFNEFIDDLSQIIFNGQSLILLYFFNFLKSLGGGSILKTTPFPEIVAFPYNTKYAINSGVGVVFHFLKTLCFIIDKIKIKFCKMVFYWYLLVIFKNST
jgi:hypothetical protein